MVWLKTQPLADIYQNACWNAVAMYNIKWSYGKSIPYQRQDEIRSERGVYQIDGVRGKCAIKYIFVYT